jgi:hypothetical protein
VASLVSGEWSVPTQALPVRRGPIEAEDFAHMRRDQEAPGLLRAAEAPWPQPGQGTTGAVWCTVICGTAIRCGTATAA